MSFDPNANRFGGDPQDPAGGGEGDGGQPATRRYGGGKYATVDDLEKGYSESFREVDRIRAEKEAARAEAETYRRLFEEARSRPAPAPAEPEPAYIPVDENGVPRAHVQRLAAEAAGKAAREAVAQALAPLMQGVQARTQMLQANPEYGQNEVSIQQWLSSNPSDMQTYQDIAQVNPVAAMQFAFRGWKSSQPAPAPAGPPDNSSTQAGLPPTSPTGRNAERPEADQRKYNELLKSAQESGDFSEFLKFRLSGVVPEGHLKRPA